MLPVNRRVTWFVAVSRRLCSIAICGIHCLQFLPRLFACTTLRRLKEDRPCLLPKLTESNEGLTVEGGSHIVGLRRVVCAPALPILEPAAHHLPHPLAHPVARAAVPRRHITHRKYKERIRKVGAEWAREPSKWDITEE
eukprot:6449534-Prymnesium_polylepis.1